MTFRERLVGWTALGHRGADALRPLAPLLTRLVIGVAFFHAGLGKWHHFERTVGFFANIGIPAPAANAAFVSTIEVVGGLALILGVATRLFAFLLSPVMLVAMVTADRSDIAEAFSRESDKGLTDVAPLVFLMFLLWLVAFGAGPVSIDRLVRGRRPPVA